MLKTDIDSNETTDTVVTCQTNQGAAVRAPLMHLTRHLAVFEINNPELALRTSEVLRDFTIAVGNRTVYAGKAMVGNLMDTGPLTVCQVNLDEQAWADLQLTLGARVADELRGEFQVFMQGWQQRYRLSSAYKVIIADMQSFLNELRLWMDRVEMRLRVMPIASQKERELEIIRSLSDPLALPANSLFDRFEEISDEIEEELRPAHRSFGQRQLHPLLLCSPFMRRCFSKPLGFAGDYEMINMIIRNRCDEGNSLYAKLVNTYLLDLGPPRAVRNRVGFLKARIVSETARLARQGQLACIFSVACGPAREIEEFIAEHPLANHAQFSLLDFSEETLHYANARLEQARRAHGRGFQPTLVKNSVQQLLKNNARRTSTPAYDLIYCSGLYDYLSDPICRELNSYLYDLLLPGGLLVVGNFAPSSARRYFMEDLCEWFLIYRDSRKLLSLAPRQAPPDECVISAEHTGANIFMEVRKPQ